MNHLIVCDLDGSLLNHEGDIAAFSKRVLRHLESLGHKVIIATGRPYSAAINIYHDLGIFNPLITDNGGMIHHPKDPSFKQIKTLIPKEVTHKLFKATRDYLDSAFYSDDERVYAYKYDPRLRMFFSSLDKREVLDKPFDEFETEATGIIYLVKTPDVDAFEHYMNHECNEVLSFRMWGLDQKHAVYEIYLKHISKASAIEHVRTWFQIDRSNVIAFGDGVNDLEMLEYANPGVAMKNAMPELKDVADIILDKTNDEHGIAYFLLKHFNVTLPE